MDTILVLAALSIPISMNSWATRLVLTDALISRQQKRSQLLLIWLLPFVGALLVLAIHRKEEPASRKYVADKDPGDDFTFSGKSVKGVTEALDGD